MIKPMPETRRRGGAGRTVQRSCRAGRRTATVIGLALLAACGGDKKETAGSGTPPGGAAGASATAARNDTAALRPSVLNSDSPQFLVEAYEVRDELLLPSEITFAPGTEFRFLPFTRDDPAGLRVRTFFRVAGQDFEVGDHAPLRTDAAPLSAPGGDGIAGLMARIEMRRFWGSRGRVGWRVEGSGDGRTVSIGAPAFVRVQGSGPRPPDLLIICSDTHRLDHATAGEGPALMPELTRLRRSAVTYSNCAATASWTLPSVASVFTGLDPQFHRTGERTEILPAKDFDPADLPADLFHIPAGANVHLYRKYDPSLVSLGDHLRGRGYYVAGVLANAFWFVSAMAADGFDVTVNLPERGEVLNAHARPFMSGVPAAQPLALFVHYSDVHAYVDWYFKPAHGDAEPTVALEVELREKYRDAVRDCDRLLGELLRDWEAARGPGSMILFFSDHGEHLWEAPIAALHDSPAPIQGHGNSMMEELLRVPLVVRPPGATTTARNPETGSAGEAGETGVVVRDPVCLTDIFPTVLAAAGLAPPAGEFMRARPLPGAVKAAAADPASGSPDARVLFSDFQWIGREMSAVRRGNWKLIMDRSTGAEALIDLTRAAGGAGEPGSVSSDAALAAELRSRHDAQADAERRNPLRRSTIRNAGIMSAEESLRQLGALGYVK